MSILVLAEALKSLRHLSHGQETRATLKATLSNLVEHVQFLAHSVVLRRYYILPPPIWNWCRPLKSYSQNFHPQIEAAH